MDTEIINKENENQETINQEVKYYAVTAKCGHVGRGYYILIEFGVGAKDAKEAARIARSIPRVKHDHKDAIRKVREISREEYLKIQYRNYNDPYLKAHNKQDQETYCKKFEKRLLKEKDYDYKDKGKKKIDYKKKKKHYRQKNRTFGYSSYSK